MDSSSPSDNNNQEAKPLSHVQRIRATVFNHTPPSLQQQPTTNRTSPPHLPARRETVKPTSLPQSHQNKSSPITSNATITVGANPPSENVNSAQVGENHTTPPTRNRMAALMNSSTTTPTNTTGHHSAPVVSRQHHRHQTIRPASHSPFSTNPPPATAATTASTTTSSNTPPVTAGRASNASDWRASIEAFRSGGSNGGLMDHLQQQFGHETTQPSNRFSMKVNNNNNNTNNVINNINNTTTTKTSCHQNDIESTANLAPASEKPLTIQVKLFETTDTITTVQCTDPDTSIRTFLQNLILNYIMKGANNNTTNTNTNKNDVVNTSNENAVNQIMNMYSFLLVNQMAYHTNNRWIVDYDTPMRHLRQCGDHRSVLHFISKNKKVNVIVRSSSSDHPNHSHHHHHQNQLHTFSLSVPMDETWTVAQLTLEIAKKLAVKRPYDMDFGLRHFSLSVKSSGSGGSMIVSESASGVGGKSDNSSSGNADDDDKNILLKNRYLNSPWLDMELSLREQGFDPASDYVVFSRRFFFYFDEMIQQSEMLFDLVSMTFFDARCKFLSGAIDMNVASQSQVASSSSSSSSALLPLSSTLSSSETDTLSPELIDLIAVEALGAGINQSMLAKDKKLFKLLIPESKLKTYEANKLKIRKDIIQCVTTKSTKTNENMAQKKFIEAVSRDHLYKMDLYPATTKLPGTEGAAEVLIGVDTMAVYMIHRRNRNVLQQYDLDGITHFAGLKASFHLIAVVRGKQGRTEFDTEYGKQIENAVQCCIIAARSMRRRPPSAATAPTTTSSNNPINDFETMLKDGELVKKAQDELFDLERKMFNTGSLRDLCSTEVSTSLHPLPNTNNLELETMEKLIKNEAEVRCLSMYKNVIKGYLDATRVGTYNRSVPTMKSELDQVILDIEQQSNPNQHSIQRLKELVDSQYSSLVNYENYLHSKAELLLRKREDCIINNSQANNHLIRQNTPPKLVDKLRAHTILSK